MVQRWMFLHEYAFQITQKSELRGQTKYQSHACERQVIISQKWLKRDTVNTVQTTNISHILCTNYHHHLLPQVILIIIISRRTWRSETSAHFGNDQLQRDWVWMSSSINWICQLSTARWDQPGSESHTLWRQPDCLGKEDRRCATNCRGLYFTPYRS